MDGDTASCPSFNGICRDKPLRWPDGLRGVVGFVYVALSSFVTRRGDSRIAGDGESAGLRGLSDRDRVLFAFGVSNPSSSLCSSCLVRFDLAAVAAMSVGAAVKVVDIVSSVSLFSDRSSGYYISHSFISPRVFNTSNIYI